MSEPYNHLVRAVQVLAPLMYSESQRRWRRPSKSRKVLKDLRRAAPWFRSNNIVGVVVSRKASGVRRDRGDLCLKFLVRRKLPESRLSEEEFIPSLLKLESVRHEIPTDVEVMPDIPVVQASGVALPHTGARVRPVVPGVSIGHPHRRGGTLGLVVHRGGQDFYLSCAHVLAPGGAGHVKIGDTIEQPADLVGDEAENAIGVLAEFTNVRAGSVDAAIAQANDTPHSGEVAGIGIPDALLPDEASKFTDSTMILVRNGDGSGMQEGSVDGFGSVPLFFDDLREQVTLNGVILYNAANNAGDSGAAVFVKGTRKVAGLHVGAMSKVQSVCIPIKRVFDALNISL